MRCCEYESGRTSGRGSTRVTGGSALARSATAAASSRTVGASKTSRIDASTPSASDRRATRRIADNELPPAAKNESVAPTRSLPRTSPNTAAIVCSISPDGATYSPTVPRTESTDGNALRSTLPETVNTISSTGTHAVGRMYSGNRSATTAATVSTLTDAGAK
ncbi:hypothetical protein GCM10023197_41250 [Gordonia humi]